MKKKWIILLAFAAAAALTLAACGKKPADEESSLTSSEISSSLESSGEQSGSSDESGTSTPSGGQVVIYDAETETASSTSVDTEDGKDLNETLIDALNEIYGSKSDGKEYKISVNKVEVKDKGITIDFKEGSIPAEGVGSSEENACLRSIAETFLQNYPDADTVYFTVEGGIYSSGHQEFAEGEPFMDRSMMEKP